MRGRCRSLLWRGSIRIATGTYDSCLACSPLPLEKPLGPLKAAFGSYTDRGERKYPFKPPLQRIKSGGKWMPNPAAVGSQAPRPPPPPPRTFKRRHVRPQHARVALPNSAEPAIVQIGRRLGRPNLDRINRVRAAQAKAEGDKPQVIRRDIWEEAALSHNSGLQLLFLGTGRGHPAEQRRVGSVAIKLLRSSWLFDCGEDTQRQMHKQPLIRHGKLDRIFISSSSTCNILGLPGMLCTMSAAREVGLDLADVPLHVYGPPGLAEFIRPLLQCSDSFISMPIIVHELVDHAVDPREMTQPKCLDRRSCLYRLRLPPDKLNPKGYYDGAIVPFLTRATSRTNQLAKGLDERINPRDLELPSPGNPGATLVGLQDLRWTIKCDRETKVVAARVQGAAPSWAFVASECAKVGRLDTERCQQLKVLPGARFSRLKEGKSVYNTEGNIVQPEQVLGPDIPGRILVMVAEGTDSSPILDLAKGADVVIHCASSEVRQTDGTKILRSTIDQASAFCRAANAQHLILYRFKPGREAAQVPYKRAPPADSDLPPSEREQEEFLEELNTLGRLKWVKIDAMGGYLGRARNFFDPVDSPLEIVEAAESFASGITGNVGRVSVADDMGLYAIDRRIPKLEDAATIESPERASRAAA